MSALLSGFYCIVNGRVQGVWFRASTKKEADALGITGWVRNLPDGRVEIAAYGEPDKLAILHEWLKHGPEHAEVVEFVSEERIWEDFSDFQIK